MFCKNCGREISDFDTMCQICGTPVTTNQYSSTGYGQQNNYPIKTTGLLVWSIIEIFCVNTITGIIGTVLWATKLKPAADRGDIDAALKAKRNIKIALWIGIILSVLIIPIIMCLIAVPNFSGINNRMQVRADIATAHEIGMLAQIWYNDFKTDPALANNLELKLDIEQVENELTKLNEIKTLQDYWTLDSVPSSYQDNRGQILEGAFYVTIINEDTPNESKIIVAIGPKDLTSIPKNDYNFYEVFYKDLEGITESTYNGEGSGIAYLEGEVKQSN